MKRYLFSLVCAALAGTAWAQSPAAVLPTAQGNVEVIPAGTAAAAAALRGTTAQAATALGRKCDDVPCGTKTTCVPEHVKVVKTKVRFSSTCETLCHTGICNFLKKKSCDDCASCPDHKCGHAYTRRHLEKRIEKTECDTVKCVPVHVPACEKGRRAPKCKTPVCAGGTCRAPATSAPATVPATVSLPAIPEPITVAPASNPVPAAIVPAPARPVNSPRP
jgi:hypothetical protein